MRLHGKLFAGGLLKRENCVLPLPVADAGKTQFPQPRHWRAVAKQAREWQSRQGEQGALSLFIC